MTSSTLSAVSVILYVLFVPVWAHLTALELLQKNKYSKVKKTEVQLCVCHKETGSNLKIGYTVTQQMGQYETKRKNIANFPTHGDKTNKKTIYFQVRN